MHFDVPWNPMELEQRVGRVHRYGSVDTVVVDTLVLAQSREKRVLDRARARLGKIVGDLDRGRLELLYSRTMSLIPLDELSALMAGEHFDSVSNTDEERIDQLVSDGYSRWKARDEELRQKRAVLDTLDRGTVNDADLESFLTRSGRAEALVHEWSWRLLRVDEGSGKARIAEEPARVFRLASGALGFIGRSKGVALVCRERNSMAQPVRIGLNHPEVALALRMAVGGSEEEGDELRTLVRGVGSLLVAPERWRSLFANAALPKDFEKGFILIAACARWLDRGTDERELRAELQGIVTDRSGEFRQPLESHQLSAVLRAIREPRPKRNVPSDLSGEGMMRVEDEMVASLRPRSARDPNVAVFPVACLWIEPSAE